MASMWLAYAAIFLVQHVVAEINEEVGEQDLRRLPPIFANFTSQEAQRAKVNFGWSPDLDKWVPPEDIRKNYRYYVAGYDFEGRPVGVAEVGRWDVKSLVDKGEESANLIGNYTRQGLYRLCTAKSPIPDAEEGVVLIFDCEGFHVDQLSSSRVVKSHLQTARWAESCGLQIAEFYVINLSFAGATWVELARPVAGSILGRATILGPDKTKLKAFLTQRIPKDQLPPWYGGLDSFKPVKIW